MSGAHALELRLARDRDAGRRCARLRASLAACAALVALSAGCTGPQAIDAPDLDVVARTRSAKLDLFEPARAARAHLDLAWLCLLHGVDCASLEGHAEAAVEGAPDMALAQLTRALARQPGADVRRRATAWLDLVLWAQAEPHGPDLTTLGLEALARLARRDRSGVRAAVSAHTLRGEDLRRLAGRAPGGGGATAALRRARRAAALASWAPKPAAALGPRPTVTLAPTVHDRRLYAGLRGAPTQGAVAQGTATPVHLRAGLWRARLPLPDGPGAYAVRLRFPAGARGTLLLSADVPLVTWTARGVRTVLAPGGAPLALPRTSDAPVRLRVALAREGASLRVALVPAPSGPTGDAGARPTQAPAGSGLPLRVVSAVLSRQGDAHAWLAKRFPAGPLAGLLALERGGPGALAAGDTSGLDATAGLAPAAWLDRVLDHLPHHVDARIDRATRARDESQTGLARRLTSPLRRQAAQRPALARRADLWLEVAAQRQVDGLGDLATRASERARVAQPGDCGTWRRAAAVVTDALDRDGMRRLLAHRDTARCTTPLQRAELLGAAGQSARALDALALAARDPATRRRARARARQLTAHRPQAAPWAWRGAPVAARAARLAGRALTQGRPAKARAAWTRVLLGRGASPEERRHAWLLGGRAPWQGLAVDGEAWVRAHPAKGAARSAVTWLLDHEVVVPLPGGGALRRVHQIVRVHSAGAAEAVGEINVPASSELVLARTHTTDGRLLSPADTPDKESVSLREVTPGAAVEYVQVQFVAPDDVATGATRLPTFLLQSPDGPVIESRYQVLDRPAASRKAARPGAPAQAPLEVAVAPAPGAPKPVTGRHRGWRLRTWTLRQARRFRLEPRSNQAAWHLAAVRATTHATRESVVGPWVDALEAYAAKPAPALAPWVRKARAAGRDPARWQTLIHELAATVSHKRVGTRPGDPATALGEGSGDRASLLVAVARAAGVPACLVRVRPWSRQPSPTQERWGAPAPRDYGLAAVTLDLRGGRVWVDPAVDGGLLNYLRAGLRRRPALRVGCDPKLPVALTTPDVGAPLDRRDVSVALRWEADGAVVATVRDTLRGVLAAVVRSMLRADDKAQHVAVLRQLTSAAFPGMKPAWIDVTGLNTADQTPLVLRYRVTAAAASQRRTRLRLGLTPYRLGRRYAALAQRRMTLRMGHALDVAVTLRVASAGGAVAPLLEAKASHRLVQVQRTTTVGDTWTLRYRLRSQMGLVVPAAYGAFARAARAVDRAEVVTLRREPGVAPRR